MKIRTAAGAALGAVILAGLAAPPAAADELRLVTGRAMHGTVDRGYLDPEYVRIQLFATGGVVKVRWDHVVARDRDRWQIDLGLKEDDQGEALKVDGHKVLFNNNDTRYGLIQNPDAMDGGPAAIIRLLSQGHVEEYPRSQIAKVEDARLDLPQVYTPRQAYEARRDEITPVTGRGHFDLAEYSRMVGAYEEALEHYKLAREDGEFAQTALGKSCESRVARTEILVKNKALQEQLDTVKRSLIVARSQRNFQRAASMYVGLREDMLRIMEQHPDPELQKEFRVVELGTRVEAERRAFFQRNMAPEVYRRLRAACHERSREQKVKDIPPGIDRAKRAELEQKGTFQGARQWAARQCAQDLWDSLLRDVGATKILEDLRKIAEKDATKLTEEDRKRIDRLERLEKSQKAEILEFWNGRSKSMNTVTTFGYGSFIISKADRLKDLGAKKAPAQPQGGNRNQPRNQPRSNQGKKADQAKTADQWWDAASSKEKSDWLVSYFAKYAGVLEIIQEWNAPCSDCGGLGYHVAHVASTGDAEATRCDVCNGAGDVIKLRWR